jgi:hypothetical protein
MNLGALLADVDRRREEATYLSSLLADVDRRLDAARDSLGEAPDDNTNRAIDQLRYAVVAIQEVVKVLALGRPEPAAPSAGLEGEVRVLRARLIDLLPPVDGDSMGAPSYRSLAEENAKLKAELAVARHHCRSLLALANDGRVPLSDAKRRPTSTFAAPAGLPGRPSRRSRRSPRRGAPTAGPRPRRASSRGARSS